MDFQNQQTYNFSIFGKEVVSTDFTRCIVEGAQMSAKLIRSIPGQDGIDAVHALIRPYLPQGSLPNIDDHSFIYVTLASGIKTAVSTQWIVPDSIELVTGKGVRVTTQRNLTDADIERIRAFFSLHGLEINMELI